MQMKTAGKYFNKDAILLKMTKMVDLLRILSIRQRIIGSLLLVSIFPILLVGIYSSQNYERSVTLKLTSYSGQLIEEVSQNVKMKLTNTKSSAKF